MQKRKLGSEGLEVSAIGLGLMGMSQSYGQASERDDAESIKVIHAALDQGVNFLDTAEVYGPYTNEKLLGQALKGRRRDEVVVATKFGFRITDKPPHDTDSRPEHLKKVIDQSLTRLGLDYVDLWYQHRVDPNVPIEEVVGAMGEVVDAGKVRFLGLSEAGPETLKRAQRTRKISALQSEYSLWERGLEERIIPVLRELDIGLVAFCPLGRGFLTGEIKSFDQIPEGDYRRIDPRYQGENFQRNLDLVSIVESVAAHHNARPAPIALAWVLAQGDDIIPIPGTKRLKCLNENAQSVKVSLTESELKQLSAIAEKTSGPRYSPEQMAKVER